MYKLTDGENQFNKHYCEFIESYAIIDASVGNVTDNATNEL